MLYIMYCYVIKPSTSDRNRIIYSRHEESISDEPNEFTKIFSSVFFVFALVCILIIAF